MNRAGDLADTLGSLAREADATAEVVIIDGSADDATQAVVERFRARLPELHYRRLPPAGIDRDYARAVSEARGEYCWLFTDDDWLLPGVFAAVTRALEPAPDCIVVNVEYRDASMRRVALTNCLGFDDDRAYGRGEYARFVRDALPTLHYLGSLVVRRELWMARHDTAFVGTYFAHVGRLFQQPLEGATAIVGRPGIATRIGVSSWSDHGFEIWMINWPTLVWHLPGIDEAARMKSTPREPWRDLKRLVRLRATGGFGRQDYERWIRPARPGTWLRTWSWLLCRAPVGLVNVAARFYVRCFRPHMRIYELELEGALAHWRRVQSSQTGAAPGATRP